MSALFDPANASYVGAWSLIVGVISGAVTFLGFGFTILQLLKAQGKAEAVSVALEDLKKQNRIYDTLRELERALTALESANRSCRKEAWNDLYDYCSAARTSVHNVMIASDARSTEENSSLSKAHSVLSSMMVQILNAQAEKRAYPDKTKLSAKLINCAEGVRLAQRQYSTEKSA